MNASLITAIRVAVEPQIAYLSNFEKALLTWADQTHESEVVVVDYGSAPEFAARVEQACVDVGARYLFVPSHLAVEWSRSRALNFGIKRCVGERCLFVDADSLLPREYVAAHLRTAGDEVVSFSVVRRLATADACTYDEAVAADGVLVDAGWSHCCIGTQWLRDVRGFHEGFRLWGKEDDELLHRVMMGGKRLVHVGGVVPMHLAHAKMQDWGPSHEEARHVRATFVRNEELFVETLTQKRLVAPNEPWGEG